MRQLSQRLIARKDGETACEIALTGHGERLSVWHLSRIFSTPTISFKAFYLTFVLIGVRPIVRISFSIKKNIFGEFPIRASVSM